MRRLLALPLAAILLLAGCAAPEPEAQPKVAMPAIVGDQLDDAIEDLEDLGLDVSYASGDGSTVVMTSNWTVGEQQPPEGTMVARGDHVHLVASKPADPEEQPTAAPVGCLAPSAGALASLQKGVDAKSGAGVVTLGVAAATVATERESAWFVAAELVGDGIPPDTVAVWATRYDPTVEGENAYLSVNPLAELFSDYIRPTGTVTFSLTEGGVPEAQECVTSQ